MFICSNVPQRILSNIRTKCIHFSFCLFCFFFILFFLPLTNENSLLFGYYVYKFVLMPNQPYRIFFLSFLFSWVFFFLSFLFESDNNKNRRDNDIISSFCTRNIFHHFSFLFRLDEKSSLLHLMDHSLWQGDVSRMIPELLCYYLVSV